MDELTTYFTDPQVFHSTKNFEEIFSRPQMKIVTKEPSFIRKLQQCLYTLSSGNNVNHTIIMFKILKITRVRLYSSITTALIKHFCNFGKEEMALDVLVEFDTSPAEKNDFPYATLASRASNLDHGLAAFEMMNRKNIKLNANSGKAFFKLFKMRKDSARMISLLDVLKQQKVPISLDMYVTLISTCVDAGDIKAAKRVYHESVESKLEPNSIYYNAVLKMFTTCNDFDQVQNTVETMKKQGVDFDSVTFTILLKYYSSIGRYDIGAKYKQQLLSSSKVVGTSGWNAILKLDSMNENEFDESLELAKKQRVAMDVITYNLIINHFIGVEKYEQANKYYNEMVNLIPMRDARIWGTVIKLFCAQDKLDKVEQALHHMKQQGIPITSTTYTIFLNHLVNTKRYDVAKKYLKELMTKPNLIEAQLWNVIIKLYCNTGEDHQIAATLDAMKKHSKIDIVTYTTIINHCIDNGKFEFASRYYQQVVDKGFTVDMQLENTMLKLYCATNDTKRMKQTIERMDRVGNSTYNTLINYFIEHGDHESASHYYNKLIQENVRIDVKLWGTIIKMFCLQDNFAQVDQSISQMKEQGVEPNSTIYTIILNRCVETKNYTIAKKYHAMAISAPEKIERELWNVILQLQCHAGQVTETLEMMSKYHMNLDSVAYTILITHCVTVQDYTLGQKLYHEMLDEIPPSAISIELWNTCLKLFCTMNDHQQVQDILENMPMLNKYSYAMLISYFTNFNTEKALSLVEQVQLTMDCNSISQELWNTILNLYCVTSNDRQLLTTFKEMQQANSVDSVTYTILLSYYTDNGSFSDAKKLYKQLLATDIEYNNQLWNTILKMHAVMNDTEQVQQTLSSMPKDSVTFIILFDTVRNIHDATKFQTYLYHLQRSRIVPSVRLYNVLIRKYYLMNQKEKARQVLYEMKQNNVEPDLETYIALLSDFTSRAVIQKLRRELQAKETKTRLETCVYIMVLGQSARFEQSVIEFEANVSDDWTVWYAILYSCWKNGQGTLAIQFIHRMIDRGLVPNLMCFQAALSACSYESNVESALELYNVAKRYGAKLDITMIDVLSRGGKLDQAEQMAKQVVFKDKYVAWTAVLAGCKKYKDINRMKRIRSENPDLEKVDTIMLLMRIIASTGGDDQEYEYLQDKMNASNFKKIPGLSGYVTADGQERYFTVDDPNVSPVARDFIRKTFEIFVKDYGFQANLSCVQTTQDITYEEKIRRLLSHSEKLATAEALIEGGDHDVEITKNLRMCEDCHEYAKLLSLYYKRRLLITDKAFNHIFENGKCSCNNNY